MAILVSDTPTAAKQDHLSPQQDTLQECGTHGESGHADVASRAITEAATRELRYRGGGWVGLMVRGVVDSSHDMHIERKRDRETGRQPAYRSLQLQHRRFPWLVLKDALGLRAVLPGIYLFIWGLPLVPVERWMSERGGVWDGREPILIK